MIKEKRLVTLFEESDEKVFYGLIIFRKKGAPPLVLEEKRMSTFSEFCDQTFFVDLITRAFFIKWMCPTNLFNKILQHPAEFMMEKVCEVGGITILACHHPYLVRAIGDSDDNDLGYLLKNDMAKQKILNSIAAWKLIVKSSPGGLTYETPQYGVVGLMPCKTYFSSVSEEVAGIFKRDLVMCQYEEYGDTVNHYFYCASNHPFYHDFIMLAKLCGDAPVLEDYLKTAIEDGIDIAHEIIRPELDEKIRTEDVMKLHKSIWYEL